MSKRWLVGVCGLGVLIAAWVYWRPDLALRVATGVVAHDLCSKTFVSGLDPDAVLAETKTRLGIRRLAGLLRADVDRPRQSVAASLAGMLVTRAAFRVGRGCTIVPGGAEPPRIDVDLNALKAGLAEPLLPPIAGDTEISPITPALAAALAHNFEEPAEPPLRRTKAVVVVRDGRVVAERYAPGVGIVTPLMGFSVTKSVTNALIGILVRQGRLDPGKPAPVAAWRLPGDARGAVTIEQLMRMDSGLDFDETNSGFDFSSRNLYLDADKASAAAKVQPRADPGTRWAYASPGTLILSRIVTNAVGGRPEDLETFAWHELFGPLGMRDVTLEFDTAGTWLGSTYMFASARDWARFGLLYLGDGVAGGRRLLPEGWVDFSARATLGTSYGAGFWTIRSDHEIARAWKARGVPADAYFASGDLGQRIMVLPSQRAVIVRLGDAIDPSGDAMGFTRLVREVVAALSQ